nr:uncharacterized mitochondrial protein AtMg00810-like [Tanacetum cinerariifolium]
MEKLKSENVSLEFQVVQIVLWIVDSGCSKHMTGDRSLLKNFIEKFIGTVRFGNDHFAAITGYSDYVKEVAFRFNTCYAQNLKGDDLLIGAHESSLLSHLNFGTINNLSKHDLIDGLPKFKYSKDHLCSACEWGKSKTSSHPPKVVPSNHSKLELLHMDLCGSMRVSTNEKKYILVIVDDYSRFTWVYFLHTKDETLEIIKNFIAQAHYETLGIMQQFLIARTPQQNGVVKRCNRTLVEAVRTMLIFLRLLEFLWAEAVSTTCFTQNRSIIHTRYNKTPYELLHGRKPNVKYFHMFGSSCYPTNEREDLGKMKPKADIDFPDHVYRLKKAIHGLKQALRAWYDKQSSFLIEHHFTKVHQSPRGIFLSQSQYTIELLKRYSMDEYVSMSTPTATKRLDADLQATPTDQTTYLRMIRGLMYLTVSRSDIAFSTFVYAHYQTRPTVKHLKQVKQIFQYLRQSYNMGLWYPKNSEYELIAYSDADHAGCKDDRKSTSGGLQFLGEKIVSWSSKKQDCIAMSTAEAEYVSFSTCCAQVIWMQTQLLEYGYKYNIIPMYCDSKSAIAISCNLVQHSLIMAQPQIQANVHQDELCPPNKRYALMDANKKINLDNPLCPNESKIMANILQNHPLRFSIVASSSVPWIYLGQFWHTLKEDGSKYRLSFMLDRKEITLTLDDFRIIFQLPEATDNNHKRFVAAPKFSKMVPFYINDIGFTLELRSPSNIKTTGLYYSLEHPSALITYPRFTKLIVSHYMTAFFEISRRVRDKYHNLEDDEMVKSIFNSGNNKAGVGMKIPSWMITDEMKLTEHYQ